MASPLTPPVIVIEDAEAAEMRGWVVLVRDIAKQIGVFVKFGVPKLTMHEPEVLPVISPAKLCEPEVSDPAVQVPKVGVPTFSSIPVAARLSRTLTLLSAEDASRPRPFQNTFFVAPIRTLSGVRSDPAKVTCPLLTAVITSAPRIARRISPAPARYQPEDGSKKYASAGAPTVPFGKRSGPDKINPGPKGMPLIAPQMKFCAAAGVTSHVPSTSAMSTKASHGDRCVRIRRLTCRRVAR